MKYKTTAKAIREEYSKDRIIAIGYCDAQYLLAPYRPVAYTCGVYGWNSDVYEINGFCICMGYRGMPSGLKYDHKELHELDCKAREVLGSLPYEERDTEIKKLFEGFLESLK